MAPSRFASITLFAALSASELRELEQAAQYVTYDDEQTLMLENEISRYVFFILSGTVRAFRTGPDGREQTLIHLQAGDAFNLPTAFADIPLAPATAIALGSVELLRVPIDSFQHIVTHTPSIAAAILRDLSNKLHHFTNLTHDLSLKSVRARLAKFLLANLTDSHSEPARWTREEIATQIGTVREVVSRTLRSFSNEGLIRIDRHMITLLDSDRLQDLVDS